MGATKGKSCPGRGFAALSPEKRRRIASLGGKQAHANGTAHQWTPEEAREAGRKGGAASTAAYQRRMQAKDTAA